MMRILLSNRKFPTIGLVLAFCLGLNTLAANGPDYVDEFVAQINPALAVVEDPTAVSYVLQDAQFNIVALANGAGAVTRQYTYSPYGTIVASEELAPHPPNSVGFQGLFYLNLTDPQAPDPLNPGASGLYYVRNRF